MALVLARLKEHMGGTAGRGGFPVAATDEDWDERLKRSKPLRGLPQNAKDFIYGEQPIHFKPAPNKDPLLVLHAHDNDDKHVLLSPAFVYPDVERGIDLIEIRTVGTRVPQLKRGRPGSARGRHHNRAVPRPGRAVRGSRRKARRADRRRNGEAK